MTSSVSGRGNPYTSRGVLYRTCFLKYCFISFVATFVNFKSFLKEIWGQSNRFCLK